MNRSILDQPLFRIVVPPFYGLMMYILILLINNSLAGLADSVFTNELLICVALAYLISEPIRLSIHFFEKRYGSELRKASNIAAMMFVNVLLGAIIVFVATYSYHKFVVGFTYFSTFQRTTYTLTAVYSISAIFYTLFFLSVYFLTIKNETELKKEDLKRQNLEHQLEIFNNEINPDLLFQSLETLITLVHHNLDAAEDFVDHLAQVYRYILDNRKVELVGLDEEIRASKNLIYLFQEKFPDQIKLTVKNGQKNQHKKVIPTAIPMVLDCIMNGSIISKFQPLEITIDCNGDEDYLVIQHKQNDKLSNSKYLKKRRGNLHEAYAYFTDKPVIEIKAYGDAFVKLPLLDVNENV
ncbi:histidine kinase [Roseivirga pacifica]|uniref:histidine kinase n=1 Tax=Roseivirga pacifica TaxID=1267423 RepID=UPI00227AB726|nr:sensor histidine kinase [Roseivirga pacifica]